MLELIQKIKLYTEAGIILEHMELFDEVGKETKSELIDLDKPVIMKCPTCGMERTFYNSRFKCFCSRCMALGEENHILQVFKQGE